MQLENQHEQFCLDNADHFTAVRGRVAGNRTRETFATLDEACAYGRRFGDGRTMIYAVTKEGRSAHILNG